MIKVTVSGFDILRALLRARQVSNKVALVTYRETNIELEEVKKLIDLDIEQRAYTTMEDANFQFKDLKAKGYNVVIGSSLITQLAEKAGLMGILAYSSQAVHEAVDAAIEVTRTRRIEQDRHAWFNKIIHHLNEGVIAVDASEQVQCFNPASERILGISADKVIDRRLSDVVPALSLGETLASGKEELQQVVRVGPSLLVASRVPLRDYGMHYGAVVTLQDSATIETADRNIRSQQRTRHYDARYKLEEIIGDSAAIARARELATQYANFDATVLITGESGTGKELFAQGIHNASRRANGRFVAANCAAFAESLLESELFGYEEGAFTGARKGGRPGLIEAAHGGTLFLDEIGDMPINLQTRLLRALQEKEVTRVGGTLATPVDVRIIAATHVDLKQRMFSGEFRADLYYRLNILNLHVPPLRERPSDLMQLARHLLGGLLAEMEYTRDVEPLLESLREKLEAYSWPGNVREMENLMERLAVFHVSSEGWPQRRSRAALRTVVPELLGSVPMKDSTSLKARRRKLELAYIQKVVAECDGRLPEAAKRLGVSRTTIWRKLNGASGASSAK